MFTRGYRFHTKEHGEQRNTYNYGVCVKGASYSDSSDDPDFYGILLQILQVQYPGVVGLKTILFRCHWYDNSELGMRKTRWGGIEIQPAREYPKYDPFILSSQADQVCFLPYPCTKKRRRDEWLAVVRIKPRGLVSTDKVDSIDGPLQEDNDEPVIPLQLEGHVERLAYHEVDGDLVNENDDDIHDAEREDEFGIDSNEDDSTSTDPDSL